MSSTFKDRLRQIRDASSRQSAIQLKLRSEEDLIRSQRTVRAFEFREQVEEVIDRLADSFQAEAPCFVLTRGFFEGKYMLALRFDEEALREDGRTERTFSRVLFLLAPHADDETFSAQCKKTIRHRDLETMPISVAMSEEGLATLSTFIDEQFIAFAKAYFEPSAPNPVQT